MSSKNDTSNETANAEEPNEKPSEVEKNLAEHEEKRKHFHSKGPNGKAEIVLRLVAQHNGTVDEVKHGQLIPTKKAESMAKNKNGKEAKDIVCSVPWYLHQRKTILDENDKPILPVLGQACLYRIGNANTLPYASDIFRGVTDRSVGNGRYGAKDFKPIFFREDALAVFHSNPVLSSKVRGVNSKSGNAHKLRAALRTVGYYTPNEDDLRDYLLSWNEAVDAIQNEDVEEDADAAEAADPIPRQAADPIPRREEKINVTEAMAKNLGVTATQLKHMYEQHYAQNNKILEQMDQDRAIENRALKLAEEGLQMEKELKDNMKQQQEKYDQRVEDEARRERELAAQRQQAMANTHQQYLLQMSQQGERVKEMMNVAAGMGRNAGNRMQMQNNMYAGNRRVAHVTFAEPDRVQPNAVGAGTGGEAAFDPQDDAALNAGAARNAGAAEEIREGIDLAPDADVVDDDAAAPVAADDISEEEEEEPVDGAQDVNDVAPVDLAADDITADVAAAGAGLHQQVHETPPNTPPQRIVAPTPRRSARSTRRPERLGQEQA